MLLPYYSCHFHIRKVCGVVPFFLAQGCWLSKKGIKKGLRQRQGRCWEEQSIRLFPQQGVIDLLPNWPPEYLIFCHNNWLSGRLSILLYLFQRLPDLVQWRTFWKPWAEWACHEPASYISFGDTEIQGHSPMKLSLDQPRTQFWKSKLKLRHWHHTCSRTAGHPSVVCTAKRVNMAVGTLS